MPISKIESTKIVKLNLNGLSQEQKEIAKNRAGEIIVDEIQSYLDSSRSPVKGMGSFQKKANGEDSELFEVGNLRGEITFRAQQDDSIIVGIPSSAPLIERLKAFNHNTGDTLPQRKFIPSPSQSFKDDVMERVNRAIDSIRSETPQTQTEDLGIDRFLQDSDLQDILNFNFNIGFNDGEG